MTKVMSSFYEVLIGGAVVSCRPRGRFKIESQEVLAGDEVAIRALEDGTGYIEEVRPRRNSLLRPPIANIDTAVVITSYRDPPLNLELVDRILVHARMIKVAPVVVLNKADLATASEVSPVRDVYLGAGCDFYLTIAISGVGVDDLRTRLSGRTSVLVGQSGVGKSRLLNALLPTALRKVGDVSQRVRRGRHTTRHVELISLPGGGFIADTPGFSLLDQVEVGLWELASFFPEIARVQKGCRFTDCLHRDEPGCAVKEARADGTIPASRHESYLVMLKEAEEMESRRYV